MGNNPFAINFGIIPSQYIERDLIREEVINGLMDNPVQNPCYMLTGVRGSGKTVTMTAIEREIINEDGWIVINLSTDRDMLTTLVAKLYDSKKYLRDFLMTNVNLSIFGVGVNMSNNAPVADVESALEIILREVQNRGKKVLVTIDEVSNTIYMRQFASTYQILIRQGLPLYLIMAGLYENIHDLENQDNLTFLYRTPKIEMEPLNISLVTQRYMRVFNLNQEKAFEMALITKGYPFAYQVLGKYVWESPDHSIDDEVISRFDAAMARYVYDKMWSELSQTDKWYLSFISRKNSMEISELLELTNKKKYEFSQYRARLRDKGIIDVSNRGVIAIKLPRFAEYVKLRYEMDYEF